ncbi:protein rep, partial [Enterobacter hormaechei]|uniref:protein rep n=1 Tax=Enterobacter hormaechei TaxID=158836 RepID=UPI003D1134B0
MFTRDYVKHDRWVELWRECLRVNYDPNVDVRAAITSGLLALASSGELKTRQDVTEALERAGFEVVRTTKSSISIADPDGGRNIR